jgi:hypothetical protein
VPYKWELGGVCHEGCAAVMGIASYLGDLIGKDKGAKVTRQDAKRAFELMAAAEEPLQVCVCVGNLSLGGHAGGQLVCGNMSLGGHAGGQLVCGNMSLGGHAGGQLVCGNCACDASCKGRSLVQCTTIALPLLDKIRDGKQLVQARPSGVTPLDCYW